MSLMNTPQAERNQARPRLKSSSGVTSSGSSSCEGLSCPTQASAAARMTKLKPACTSAAPSGTTRQDLHREDDLLHIARVAPHRRRGAAHGLAEDVERDQAAVEVEGEGDAAALGRPARLEDVAEDEDEDPQHDERVEKDPQQPEVGAAVAQQDVALDQLPQKVTVTVNGKHAADLDSASIVLVARASGSSRAVPRRLRGDYVTLVLLGEPMSRSATVDARKLRPRGGDL